MSLIFIEILFWEIYSENNEEQIMLKISVQQQLVPETSYSSSEGEDDFYDANDDPFSSQVTTPTR